MKKSYIIENLHCSGCASKIQFELEKIKEITGVNVDFYRKKISYELLDEEKDSEIFNKINEIMDKVEPGTRMKRKVKVALKKKVKEEKQCECGSCCGENEKKLEIEGIEERVEDESGEGVKEKREKLVIGVSVVFFIVGLLLGDGIIKKILLLLAYFLAGYDILWSAIKNISKGKVLDENFLMGIATVGALLLKDFGEAAGVMIFFKVGEYFQERAVDNSRKSIESLMDIKPEFANLKVGGEIKKVSPEKVKIGDEIVIKVGERVPLDCEVIKGRSSLDMSAITGESVPVGVEKGDIVISGAINLSEAIELKVLKDYSQSTVSRIIELVENAGSKKANAEKFITKFARYYTPVVVGLALVIAIVFPLIFTGGFKLWLSRALIFLVISCPCALVLSIPLTFFSSIGKASKLGILIKGGNYLERLNKIDKVVFDKTGTLTHGKFEVKEVKLFDRFSEQEVLEYAKAGEIYSNHPIGKAIVESCSKEIDLNEIKNYVEKAGYGVKTNYRGKEILIGNEKFLVENKIQFEKSDEDKTQIYVAIDFRLVGKIIVEDMVKETSRKTIERLRDLGISSYLLTGDNEKIGKKVGKDLGLDEDKIFTQLLPEDKVNRLEEIKKESQKGIIFVGDGINDAPVLAMADIGISMGKVGSDIAIESSDIVLMNDEPYKIIEALELGKRNNKIVMENIIFALGVKVIVMILGVLGIANLWLAIFADVGVALIAVLNASKILKK